MRQRWTALETVSPELRGSDWITTSLPLCLSTHVSVSVCLSLSVSLSVSLHMSLSVCLSVSLHVCVCVSLSLSLCISLYVSLSLKDRIPSEPWSTTMLPRPNLYILSLRLSTLIITSSAYLLSSRACMVDRCVCVCVPCLQCSPFPPCLTRRVC